MLLVSALLTDEDGEAGEKIAMATDETPPTPVRCAPDLISSSNFSFAYSSTRGAPPSDSSPAVLLHPLLLRSDYVLPRTGGHRRNRRIGCRVR